MIFHKSHLARISSKKGSGCAHLGRYENCKTRISGSARDKGPLRIPQGRVKKGYDDKREKDAGFKRRRCRGKRSFLVRFPSDLRIEKGDTNGRMARASRGI